MNLGIYNAVRGCKIQQLKFDTIANNLANVATTGFKKSILHFDQMLKAHQKTTSTQGNMRRTGNLLDIGLSGRGFFKASTSNGVRYTRNGGFNLNSQGMLTTSSGDPVLGSGGPISVEGKEITFDKKGGIEVDGTQADTLSVVDFQDSVVLKKEGAYYSIGDGDEAMEVRPQQTSVQQGYLEESNVVVAEEMVRMVEALRDFESYQKVLQTFSEIDAKVINTVGSP